MLDLDDNMFKLAKMLETLLKISSVDRKQNLEKYKKTVLEIDMKAFDSILREVEHLNGRNQPLEKELPFLESLKAAYNQLVELQSGFKEVCKLYGDSDLKLSDLSRLNIEYIDSRIAAINGYLVNSENIKKNKEELDRLTKQLAEEEKNRIFLNNRLLELEKELRESFCRAEGRHIIAGKLQYASIVSEYEKLGYDFRKLLDNFDELRDKISELEVLKSQHSETYEAAKLCYDRTPTAENKELLADIKKEYLLIKYELDMLKIIQLLSVNCNDYRSFLEKRNELVKLREKRKTYLENLGIEISDSYDPFNRTSLDSQMNSVKLLEDNSRNITQLLDRIKELDVRTENMIAEDKKYREMLSETRSLIEDKVRMSDIDTSSVKYDFEDLLTRHVILPNQVVGVKDISSKFNERRASQKALNVISRVNKVFNGTLLQKEETRVSVSPELVIIPKKGEPAVQEMDIDEEDLVDDTILEESNDLETVDENDVQKSVDLDNLDIFETVEPFTEPKLFVEKAEEVFELPTIGMKDSLTDEELFDIANKPDNNLELMYNQEITDDEDLEMQMPEFWPIQSEVEEEEEVSVVPSFDEQVEKLRADSETNMDVKIRKKVA